MSHPRNEGPQTAVSSVPCSVADCGRDAWHGGLCHAHVKRRQRGLPLSRPLRERSKSAWEGLLEAAYALADASNAQVEEDANLEWRRALWRFASAIKRYGKRKRGVRIPYGELWKIARARRS